MTTLHRLKHREGGVSLIEVLVAMVLIALAMFSAIALQVYALRMAASSTSRSQAINLSAEIAERMEANVGQAIKGAYATPTASTASLVATDCSISACSPADLVAYDLAFWSQKILKSSPKVKSKPELPSEARPSFLAKSQFEKELKAYEKMNNLY